MCEGWIMPVEGDDTRARCRYCRILLRAHNSDLRNHARSSRHATSVAFGRPCCDPLNLQSTPRTKTMGLTSSSRKRLGLNFFIIIIKLVVVIVIRKFKWCHTCMYWLWHGFHSGSLTWTYGNFEQVLHTFPLL